MKKLLLLIPISIILCSCPDMGESKYYDYTIENKSGKQITFIPYSDGNILLDKKVILDNNKALNKSYKEVSFNSGLSMTDVIFNKSISNLSHIEIAFENQKKIIYQQCSASSNCYENPRNIFNPANYDEEKETYSITPEDYQNATDCNGNCY